MKKQPPIYSLYLIVEIRKIISKMIKNKSILLPLFFSFFLSKLWKSKKSPQLLLFLESHRKSQVLFISLYLSASNHYKTLCLFHLILFLLFHLLIPFHLIIMTSCNTKYSLIYWIISYKDLFFLFSCVVWSAVEVNWRYRWKVYRAITS